MRCEGYESVGVCLHVCKVSLSTVVYEKIVRLSDVFVFILSKGKDKETGRKSVKREDKKTTKRSRGEKTEGERRRETATVQKSKEA